MTTESQTQAAILKYLGNRKDCRVWRNNTGKIADRTGRVVSFGLQGSADIIGLRTVHAIALTNGVTVIDALSKWERVAWTSVGGPCGQFLAVEVKSDTGRQSEAQKNFQSMVEAFGGLYILARDVSDLYPWFPKES